MTLTSVDIGGRGMARPLRVNYAGGVYHVTPRGNERKAIVRDDLDQARFVQAAE